jgi:hypothetical protein
MCRLRFFEIDAHLGSATMYDFDILSLFMGSLRISLTSPATLEHLKFKILFRGCHYTFNSNTFYENLRDADVWRHLDSITTHPTGSRLRRVDIDINYAFRYIGFAEPVEDKVKKAVLDGLPLLHTKGILFVEAVLGNAESLARFGKKNSPFLESLG